MKTIIIYVSTYQGNTEKVAQAMADELSATIVTAKEARSIDLSEYDLIGLGSAINFAQHHRELLHFVEVSDLKNRNVFIFSTRCRPFLGKYHQELKRRLLEKGSNLVGEFSCKGFDRTGPWIAIDGYNKARPNEMDLFKARLFVGKMRRKVHPLAVFAKVKKQPVKQIEDLFIYQDSSNSNNIAGKIVLLNITTCIHCMKCVKLCPMGVFKIKENDGSQIILPMEEYNCIQCQTCAKSCPSDSIYINETFMNGIRIAVREVVSDKLQIAYNS